MVAPEDTSFLEKLRRKRELEAAGKKEEEVYVEAGVQVLEVDGLKMRILAEGGAPLMEKVLEEKPENAESMEDLLGTQHEHQQTYVNDVQNLTRMDGTKYDDGLYQQAPGYRGEMDYI